MHNAEAVATLVRECLAQQPLVMVGIEWIDGRGHLARRFAVGRAVGVEPVAFAVMDQDTCLATAGELLGQRGANAPCVTKDQPRSDGGRLAGAAFFRRRVGRLPGDAVQPAAGVDGRVAAGGASESLHLDAVHRHEHVARGVEQVHIRLDAFGAGGRLAGRAPRVGEQRLRIVFDRLQQTDAADADRHVGERAERAVLLDRHRARHRLEHRVAERRVQQVSRRFPDDGLGKPHFDGRFLLATMQVVEHAEGGAVDQSAVGHELVEFVVRRHAERVRRGRRRDRRGPAVGRRATRGRACRWRALSRAPTLVPRRRAGCRTRTPPRRRTPERRRIVRGGGHLRGGTSPAGSRDSPGRAGRGRTLAPRPRAPVPRRPRRAPPASLAPGGRPGTRECER